MAEAAATRDPIEEGANVAAFPAHLPSKFTTTNVVWASSQSLAESSETEKGVHAAP